MYTTIPKGLTPISTENAREIVDAIDDLICSHVTQHALLSTGMLTPRDMACREEQREIIKRRITDYLLVTDPRSGVYQTGPRDQG